MVAGPYYYFVRRRVILNIPCIGRFARKDSGVVYQRVFFCFSVVDHLRVHFCFHLRVRTG
jgi:hypothetical protein